MKSTDPTTQSRKPGDRRITNQDEQDVVVNRSDLQQGGHDQPAGKGKSKSSSKKDQDSKKTVRARKRKYNEEESE
jgi:hypothetical protein